MAAECGVSESTVYRRLSELGELGLVEPTNWPVADECNEYRTTLDTALVSLDDGEFSLSLGDRVDQSTDDDPNDQVDPEDVLRTLESLVEVEHATFDRETRQVELDLTVSDDLFDLLLHRELSDVSVSRRVHRPRCGARRTCRVGCGRPRRVGGCGLRR